MNTAPDADFAVFTEALRLPPEERERYLDGACKADAEFRNRVEALLLTYEQAGDFLQRPAAESPIAPARVLAAVEKPGDRIGHYKLLQQIGEGGCGVVYLAEQEGPVRRRVALKIIKPGMDTKNVIARFESERQALALMNHPNIAQVFDAGATHTGRPYFVMELVKGDKLTDYCHQHSLSLEARLELLVQVCDAIQHAHQKGIIHRDIKPSNILVATGPDRKPVPKVIDFGIAKTITGQQLTDKTIFTAYEMLIGTPAYMSPEQAALTITDVDARTDIYSLGVLLYELLTGTTPFDTRELLKIGFDEVRRVIRNEQPVRPSTRLSTIVAADPAAFSKHHGGAAPKVIRQMRGELDWIVMKALEKDRTRRYATANGFAMDIQRYLEGEPVLACPPSWLYQFRKLILRHKLEFAALGIVMATLVAGLSITTWSLAKEKAARSEANQQQKKAQLGEQKATTEATRSRQVMKFLQKMLTGADPLVVGGHDTALLRAILDNAAKGIDQQITNQPIVLADLKLIIGQGYQAFLQMDKAEPLLRQALALYRKSPKGIEQKTLISDALASLSLLHALQPNKLEEAEREVRDALDIEPKHPGEPNMRLVVLETQLAWIMVSREKAAEAEKIFRDALLTGEALVGKRSDQLLDTRGGLAVVLNLQDKFVESESMLRESLSIAQEKLPANHPYVANDLFRLASVFLRQGRFAEAARYYRQCLDIRRKMVGIEHPLCEDALLALAGALFNDKREAEATDVYGELLEARRKRLGDHDASVAEAVDTLAGLLTLTGNDAKFEKLAGQFSGAWAGRAEFLARKGRWSEARTAAWKAVELRPDDHNGYHMVALLLVQTGDRNAYEELCAKITSRFAGATNPYTADRMAKDCLILPRPGVDLKVPGELAETAVTLGRGDSNSLPYFQCCKALAEYRQGHWDAAVDWAQRISFGTSNRYALAESCAILAMAQFQLHQMEPSRASLKRSGDIVQNQLSKAESESLDDDWRDWIIAHALLTEAKNTLEVK